jgi:hypothetical protein
VLINGGYEAVGDPMTLLRFRTLLRNKMVRSVNWLTTIFCISGPMDLLRPLFTSVSTTLEVAPFTLSCNKMQMRLPLLAPLNLSPEQRPLRR